MTDLHYIQVSTVIDVQRIQRDQPNNNTVDFFILWNSKEGY